MTLGAWNNSTPLFPFPVELFGPIWVRQNTPHALQ